MALFLDNQWYSVEDILKTANSRREGLVKVGHGLHLSNDLIGFLLLPPSPLLPFFLDYFSGLIIESFWLKKKKNPNNYNNLFISEII